MKNIPIGTLGSYATGALRDEFSAAAKQVTGSLGNPNAGQVIDWSNYNYPPYLKIVHYDTHELPLSVRSICHRLHYAFIFGLFCLFINFFDNLITVFSGRSLAHLYYSFANFFIFGAIAGWTFYQGYLSLALSSSRSATKYVVGSIIIGIVYTMLGIIPIGCSNGVGRFANKKSLDLSSYSYLTFSIILETTLFLLASFFTILNWKSFSKYNPNYV